MDQLHISRRDLIASLLRRIQTEGSDISGNALILISNELRNYYIQFAAGHDETPDGRDPYSLYAEASGNEILEARFKLSDDQVHSLLSLGWKPPQSSPNYFQSWVSRNDEDRASIAELVLETFQQVYAYRFEDELKYELMIS